MSKLTSLLEITGEHIMAEVGGPVWTDLDISAIMVEVLELQLTVDGSISWKTAEVDGQFGLENPLRTYGCNSVLLANLGITLLGLCQFLGHFSEVGGPKWTLA